MDSSGQLEGTFFTVCTALAGCSPGRLLTAVRRGLCASPRLSSRCRGEAQLRACSSCAVTGTQDSLGVLGHEADTRAHCCFHPWPSLLLGTAVYIGF